MWVIWATKLQIVRLEIRTNNQKLVARSTTFLEANTPVDRDLWADFFNKCVKAQAVKKFRRYRKKFQEAVTTAQGTTAPVGTVVASPGTMTPVTRTTKKNVTFAQPVVEPKDEK